MFKKFDNAQKYMRKSLASASTPNLRLPASSISSPLFSTISTNNLSLRQVNTKDRWNASTELLPTAQRYVHSPNLNATYGELAPSLKFMSLKGYRFSKEEALVAYTDGSALGEGSRRTTPQAGAGVWWGSHGEAAMKNRSERVPGIKQTCNRGELLALILAVETCPYPTLPLEIRTDSQYAMNCVTKWLPKWIRDDFRIAGRSVENQDMIKDLAERMRRRKLAGQKITFRYVKGHAGDEGNESADRLAKMGALLPPPTEDRVYIDLQTCRGARRPGGGSSLILENEQHLFMSADEMLEFERNEL